MGEPNLPSLLRVQRRCNVMIHTLALHVLEERNEAQKPGGFCVAVIAVNDSDDSTNVSVLLHAA